MRSAGIKDSFDSVFFFSGHGLGRRSLLKTECRHLNPQRVLDFRHFVSESVLSLKVTLTGFYENCVSSNDSKTKLNHTLANNGAPDKGFFFSIHLCLLKKKKKH